MSLAAKLPYDHPYAGGYPGVGSQPLPTDADAIDYLSRMATADGAGVETGVAVAVDAFFKDAKESGVFSALKACCILAGARTLAGALVPVVGTAPTNVANGFVSGDFSRTSGLTGDGTSYIDSGRATNDDPQGSMHVAVFPTAIVTGDTLLTGSYEPGLSDEGMYADGRAYCRSRNVTVSVSTNSLYGVSRSSSTAWYARGSGSDSVGPTTPATVPNTKNMLVFSYDYNGNPAKITDATLAFYSIGTSLSLEALDTAVTDLITAIGEAL